MLLTKHAAELCALLVNDVYGELPSRILIVLLTKGRSSIAQLAQNTSLNPRYIRNGLGVLIQQNLLYYSTSSDTKITNYEANPAACYNLIRYGKILEIVESQYGSAERDLVQTLMLLGHAKIADLTQAFRSRAEKVNGHTNGVHEPSSDRIDPDSFLSVLTRLIQEEIVETVRPDSFRNPAEVFHEIKTEVTKLAPGEKATTKDRAEHERRIVEKFRSFKEQSRTLKRQLDLSQGSAHKRRKLRHGTQQNGHDDDYVATQLNPNVIVKLNHEKCLVELRNQRLVSFASDSLGEATGSVYRTLLELLTAQVPKCQRDPLFEEDEVHAGASVTTLDVYEVLEDDVTLGGIGRAPRDKIDLRSAEEVKTMPPESDDEAGEPEGEPPMRGRTQTVIDSGDEDSDDDDDDDDDVGIAQPNGRSLPVNGESHAKVKFDDDTSMKGSRLDQMRQHLLLLAESKHKFVRHCGTAGSGQWTVDFDQLMKRLRESELDAYIEQSFGRHGLRLTRILREKGKLDEKMLHTAALMRKSDVQGKMLAMQMAGVVDVQEVPKDNMRLANRTMFFWFFDSEKLQSHLLDDVYKAMLRCLQTLQVARHKERNILSFVERKDVQGKEEEVMTPEHYNKYNRHLEAQAKLLGQVMRLDDTVGVFRDF